MTEVVFIENTSGQENVVVRVMSEEPIIPNVGETIYLRDSETQKRIGSWVIIQRDFVYNDRFGGGELRQIQIHVVRKS